MCERFREAPSKHAVSREEAAPVTLPASGKMIGEASNGPTGLYSPHNHQGRDAIRTTVGDGQAVSNIDGLGLRTVGIVNRLGRGLMQAGKQCQGEEDVLHE